jgi:hypothetical protein
VGVAGPAPGGTAKLVAFATGEWTLLPDKRYTGSLARSERFGVLLLWLYQYWPSKVLRTEATSLLVLAGSLYLIFTLFTALYAMTTPRTVVNVDYTLYLFLLPLLFDTLLLFYLKYCSPNAS